MNGVLTLGDVLDEAKLLYSKLTPPRRPWDKLDDNQKKKYLEIAAFTATREKDH